MQWMIEVPRYWIFTGNRCAGSSFMIPIIWYLIFIKWCCFEWNCVCHLIRSCTNRTHLASVRYILREQWDFQTCWCYKYPEWAASVSSTCAAGKQQELLFLFHNIICITHVSHCLGHYCTLLYITVESVVAAHCYHSCPFSTTCSTILTFPPICWHFMPTTNRLMRKWSTD